MALEPTVLKTTLLTCFKTMTSDTDFSNGIANACSIYCGTASISTNDAGAVSGGAFAGTGTGTGIICVPTIAFGYISAACVLMPTLGDAADNYLADQLAIGLHSMVSAGTITTAVTGILTPPPPATPTPYGGAATGKIICSYTALAQGLKDCFESMRNPPEGSTKDGDELFAEKLSELFTDYLTAGTVSTNGQGNLAGSVGNGTVS
ncbi:MAG: hypothetical protein IKS93_04220 [Methanobrevibacter sp.]|nr:hypothetical protein [Methanobrevibacter sp.]